MSLGDPFVDFHDETDRGKQAEKHIPHGEDDVIAKAFISLRLSVSLDEGSEHDQGVNENGGGNDLDGHLIP